MHNLCTCELENESYSWAVSFLIWWKSMECRQGCVQNFQRTGSTSPPYGDEGRSDTGQGWSGMHPMHRQDSEVGTYISVCSQITRWGWKSWNLMCQAVIAGFTYNMSLTVDQSGGNRDRTSCSSIRMAKGECDSIYETVLHIMSSKVWSSASPSASSSTSS